MPRLAYNRLATPATVSAAGMRGLPAANGSGPVEASPRGPSPVGKLVRLTGWQRKLLAKLLGCTGRVPGRVTTVGSVARHVLDASCVACTMREQKAMREN